jgi:hypothetical protein
MVNLMNDILHESDETDSLENDFGSLEYVYFVYLNVQNIDVNKTKTFDWPSFHHMITSENYMFRLFECSLTSWTLKTCQWPHIFKTKLYIQEWILIGQILSRDHVFHPWKLMDWSLESRNSIISQHVGRWSFIDLCPIGVDTAWYILIFIRIIGLSHVHWKGGIVNCDPGDVRGKTEWHLISQSRGKWRNLYTNVDTCT